MHNLKILFYTELKLIFILVSTFLFSVMKKNIWKLIPETVSIYILQLSPFNLNNFHIKENKMVLNFLSYPRHY